MDRRALADGDGKPAIAGKTTHRYLPKKAWDRLTPAQKKKTDEKKVAGSRHGDQFVANTPAAKRARKTVTAKKPKPVATSAPKKVATKKATAKRSAPKAPAARKAATRA